MRLKRLKSELSKRSKSDFSCLSINTNFQTSKMAKRAEQASAIRSSTASTLSTFIDTDLPWNPMLGKTIAAEVPEDLGAYLYPVVAANASSRILTPLMTAMRTDDTDDKQPPAIDSLNDSLEFLKSSTKTDCETKNVMEESKTHINFITLPILDSDTSAANSSYEQKQDSFRSKLLNSEKYLSSLASKPDLVPTPALSYKALDTVFITINSKSTRTTKVALEWCFQPLETMPLKLSLMLPSAKCLFSTTHSAALEQELTGVHTPFLGKKRLPPVTSLASPSSRSHQKQMGCIFA